MKLNTGMEDMSEKNQYILSYLPVVKQKTYTLGAVYKHYAGKNLYSVIISRSQTNNKNIKYKDKQTDRTSCQIIDQDRNAACPSGCNLVRRRKAVDSKPHK